MKVSDIMKKRNTFSFEVFPPKTDLGMEHLLGEGGTMDKLYTLKPDYVSCTYGAGGTNVGKNVEVLDHVVKNGITAVTHFTCVGNTKEKMKQELQNYLDHGINHVLALRGDLPYGWTGTNGDLHYATELVKFIRQEFGDKFTIAVAGSPEGHIQCRSLEADIGYLKQKQDNGADYILTQLCYDMEQFKRWRDMVDRAGITLPIDVGIMPVLSLSATMTQLYSHNACVAPRELCKIFTHHWEFPGESEESLKAKREAFKEEGKEYTVRLIDEYRVSGINGIHLYALNKYDDVADVAHRAGLLDEI